MTKENLPSLSLLKQQAAWLAPARARLLRQIGIAHRQRILDLGAGYGAVTPELVRRGGGTVIALDINQIALSQQEQFQGASRVLGNAGNLPFAPHTFDLIFCQLVCLWLPITSVMPELWRVLQDKGVCVLLEPDYGGLIEYPPSIALKDLWIQGLQRAGANPLLGRQLPKLLTQAGFAVRVDLFAQLLPPSPTRFDLLAELPLTPPEQTELRQKKDAGRTLHGQWAQIAHLPFLLITATKI